MVKIPTSAFKPGVSGNLQGRPKVPEDLAAIKTMTADEVKRTIAKYLRSSVTEIREIHDDNEFFSHLKALDAIVVNIIKNAIEDNKQDIQRLEFLLQRSGVPVKVEYDDSDELDAVFEEIPAQSLLTVMKGLTHKDNPDATEKG